MQGHGTEAERGQQVIGGSDVAALRHPGHRLTVQQGFEAIPSQFTLKQIFAPLDRLVPVAALVPLTDAVPGRGGGDEIEPIQARMGRVAGEDLNKVTVLQRRGQRTETVVDAGTVAVVPHLGMDPVGEVHRGRPFAQPHHVALRGEHKHLFVEEVLFD